MDLYHPWWERICFVRKSKWSGSWKSWLILTWGLFTSLISSDKNMPYFGHRNKTMNTSSPIQKRHCWWNKSNKVLIRRIARIGMIRVTIYTKNEQKTLYLVILFIFIHNLLDFSIPFEWIITMCGFFEGPFDSNELSRLEAWYVSLGVISVLSVEYSCWEEYKLMNPGWIPLLVIRTTSWRRQLSTLLRMTKGGCEKSPLLIVCLEYCK